MSHNLTELNTYPSTVTVPDDGDARNAASVNGAFQALADRARLTRELLPDASMQLPGVTPDAYWDGSTMAVYEFTTCAGGTSFGTAGAGATSIILPSLSVSTWYYVYAYNSGTTSTPVASFEVSTVAPDISRRFKTGDTTRRYLFAFATDSAGSPFQFRKTRNQYVYRNWDPSADFVFSTTSLTSGTVNCAARVPPSPPSSFIDVLMYCSIGDTTGAGTQFNIKAHGDSNVVDFTLVPAAFNGSNSGRGFIRACVPSTTRSFDWAITTTPTIFSLAAYVRGWRE